MKTNDEVRTTRDYCCARSALWSVRHVRAFECGPAVAGSPQSKSEPISVYSCLFVVL
jgi:hypothetical protein